MSDFDGIDRDAIKRELAQFVSETYPVEGSGMFARASCGPERLIVLQERVRPILDRLYPSWATDNLGSSYQEASEEREACQRLIARIDADGEISALLAPLDSGPKLAAESLHAYVWRAASVQWETEHRADAVLAAAKAVNSLLQKKLGRRDLSEVKLVQEAFSDKLPEPGKPRLQFTSIEDDQTRENMRQGASSFGVGAFKAIRHPVGHRPEEELELSEEVALESLAAWSLFARWVDRAEVVKAAGES